MKTLIQLFSIVTFINLEIHGMGQISYHYNYEIPLTDAAYEGKYDYLAEYLHRLPAEKVTLVIDQKDKHGLTPLMLASVASRNSVEMVRELLKYHPNINEKDPQGRTATMLAMLGNNSSATRELLSSGMHDETSEDAQGHRFEDYAFISPKHSPLERKEKIKLLKEIVSYKLEKKKLKRESISYAKTAIEQQMNMSGPIIFSAHDIAEMIAKFL